MTYQEHPHFPKASMGTKVWRYLTYPRFIWLLEERALYFSKMEYLGDKYEGTLTRATLLHANQLYSKIELEGYYRARESGNSGLLVNCWHMNEHESAAMWGNYGNGIAIQTTVERLRDSVESPQGENFWLVPVTYFDYQSEDRRNAIAFHNSMFPYICKRKSFEHERELRAMIAVDQKSLPEKGRKVSIDPNKLIERIYLAPGYDTSFLKMLRYLVNERYKLNAIVEHCAYDANPLYNNLW